MRLCLCLWKSQTDQDGMKRMRKVWELFGKKVRQINYKEFAINFWQSILSLECKMIHSKWPFPSQQWELGWGWGGCPGPVPCQANPALKSLSFKWSARAQKQQAAHTALSTSWDSLPSAFLFGKTSRCVFWQEQTWPQSTSCTGMDSEAEALTGTGTFLS